MVIGYSIVLALDSVIVYRWDAALEYQLNDKLKFKTISMLDQIYEM